MTSTSERALAADVQTWAQRHGMPRFAPVAMAEQVAIDAYERGATRTEARDRAASYLRSWYAHPAVAARHA